jgi:hypothetical protein
MGPFLLPCAATGLASIAAWCGSDTTPSGSAVVTCLNATARTRRAERAVQSDVLSVWQVLHGTPSALRISALSATAWKCTKTGKMKMWHFSGTKFAAGLA